MKILVVEDEPKTGNYLKQGLLEAGFGVDLARDGDDGLHYALTDAYDLVVLDVMLPGMSGYEVLEYIRHIEAKWKRDGLKGAKVIMVTALNSSKNIMQAFRENCEGYLTKPYTTDELNDVLNKLGIYKQREFQPS